MFRQRRNKIQYVLKANNVFGDTYYFPYFRQDINNLKKYISELGYKNIEYVEYTNHTDLTDIAEKQVKEYDEDGLDNKLAQKALKCIFDEQQQ